MQLEEAKQMLKESDGKGPFACISSSVAICRMAQCNG